MTGKKPKLRSDLILSPIEGSPSPAFVLKDPITDNFFTFSEYEQYLLTLLDGRNDLEAVRRAFEERFSATLSAETLGGFLGRIESLGFLEGEAEAREAAVRQKEALRGEHGPVEKILHVRVRAFNPEKVLARLLEPARFFFTRSFVLVAVFTILAAVCVTVANWPEMTRAFGRVWNLNGFLIFWFSVLWVVALHEFAHALTCRHFGGRVTEMGFLLIYFQPAFYSDVSDAWLFPEKRKRLWVMFSGGFFQLFLWSAAAILWRLTDPDVFLNKVCYIVMAYAGLMSLFNFNPLIRLDGYYLLSDALGIPNLRKRAFGYLHDLLRRLSGAPSRREAETPGWRERAVFLIYGSFAILYSAVLVGVIALRVLRFLVGRYESEGVALYILLLLFLLRGWLLKIPGAVRRYFFPGSDMKLAAKRSVKLLVGCGIAAGVLFLVHWELRINAECRFVPEKKAVVRAQVGGLLEKIHVHEGSVVSAGDLLFSLSRRDTLSQLSDVTGRLEEDEASARLLLSGARAEEIATARKRFERAVTERDYARNEAVRVRKVFESALVSQKDLDAAEEILALREKNVEVAKGELDLLLAGTRPEEIEKVAADIEMLKKKKEFYLSQLDDTEIRSPIEGVVATPYLEYRLHENIEPGTELCEVVDTRELLAEIMVPEKEAGDIRVGNVVKLKAQGYPGESFWGRVTEIATAAQTDGDRRIIRVTTRLYNENGMLKPGMSGRAKVYCGKKTLWTLASRRVIRYLRTEFLF